MDGGLSSAESHTTMRDRLSELQQRAQESSAVAGENNNPLPEEGDDDDSVVVGIAMPQAVVFEEEPIIENFLSEAQKIRDDINALETEVNKNTVILHRLPQVEVSAFLSIFDVLRRVCMISTSHRSSSSPSSKRPWWQRCDVSV